jgi:hypothetical protein
MTVQHIVKFVTRTSSECLLRFHPDTASTAEVSTPAVVTLAAPPACNGTASRPKNTRGRRDSEMDSRKVETMKGGNDMKKCS